jgi:hypothetical protein
LIALHILNARQGFDWHAQVFENLTASLEYFFD